MSRFVTCGCRSRTSPQDYLVEDCVKNAKMTGSSDDVVSVDPKQEAVQTVKIDVEDPTGECEKAYYSKLSVWLMILFSGLAIGSDGL